MSFGAATYLWLWDTPMGYHQISIAPESQPKLAFAGTNAAKWTYNVMPFGPVNGPSTFIAFIHNIDSTWKDLAHSLALTMNDYLNTNIIVDDILSWATTLNIALLYMECQLRIAQSQNLLLSMKKSFIFLKHIEFVGDDICADGNRPAQSTHNLFHHWKTPEVVRDVAKFVGFLQFYSCFIPNFKVRISTLRTIMLQDYNAPIRG
jgi:hypothetical protein